MTKNNITVVSPSFDLYITQIGVFMSSFQVKDMPAYAVGECHLGEARGQSCWSVHAVGGCG